MLVISSSDSWSVMSVLRYYGSSRYTNVPALVTTTLLLVSSSVLSAPMPLSSSPSSSFSSSSTDDDHQPNNNNNQTRVRRRDPLRQLEYYDQGYNLKDMHYWASAAFTGIHGYAMAGTWLFCGLGFSIFLIVKNYILIDHNNTQQQQQQPANSSSSSSYHYFIVFVIIIAFVSLIAVTASGFAVAANQSSLDTTQMMASTVLGAGTDARLGIHRINKAMKEISFTLCPYDPQTCSILNVTSHQLGTQSLTIKQFLERNGLLIDQAVTAVYIANLVVVTVNLGFVVAAFVFILLHWNSGLLIVIFLCWILTSSCWFLTGIDFFLHTFAEDTCTAIDGFIENPLNNTLSSLLPCARFLRSEHVIIHLGQTVHNFIEQLNSELVQLPKQLGVDDEAYKEFQGTAPTICDPFSGAPNFSYLEGNCPKGAIPISQIPQLLERFTCYDDHKDNSSSSYSNGCLPHRYYKIANAYITSIQNLIQVYPDLHGLIHCSFVKERMTDAGLKWCGPFKEATLKLWVSLLCLSIFMIILLLLWVLLAYHHHTHNHPHEQHRHRESRPPRERFSFFSQLYSSALSRFRPDNNNNNNSDVHIV